MTKDYLDGKVTVQFKFGVEPSEIENLLKDYQHIKVFPDKVYDPKSPSSLRQQLALTYSLQVHSGEEEATISKLLENPVIEYAEKVPLRRIM